MEARSKRASKGKSDLLRLDRALSELELSVGEMHRIVSLIVEARQCPPPVEAPEEVEPDADDELGGD